MQLGAAASRRKFLGANTKHSERQDAEEALQLKPCIRGGSSYTVAACSELREGLGRCPTVSCAVIQETTR
jgi:hypothetical protein